MQFIANKPPNREGIESGLARAIDNHAKAIHEFPERVATQTKLVEHSYTAGQYSAGVPAGGVGLLVGLLIGALLGKKKS